MYDNDSKGISYTRGFFMLIAFVIAGAIFGMQLSQLVWEGMTGKPFSALVSGEIEVKDAPAHRVLQMINAVFSFLLPTLVTAFMLHRRPAKLIGFSTRNMQLKQFGMVILIFGTALMVSTALSYITHVIPLPASTKAYFDALEEQYNRQVMATVSLRSLSDYLIALFVMAALQGFCEEVVFRGGLQNFLTRSTGKPWLSIIIVSIIFSAMHFSFYGFLSRVALGVVLGALYYYSGTIWWSVIVHFLNNAMAVTILYVYSSQGKSMKEAMNQEVESFWGLIAVIPLVALFALFRNATNRRRLT